MRCTLRVFLASLLVLVSFCTCIGARAQPTNGVGYVDSARYLAGDRQLVVAGWAAPEKPNVFTTNLIVFLDGQEIYRGRMQRSERPDVAAATGRADWLSSGFSIRIAIPHAVEAGPHALKARMHLGDGTEFELAMAPAAQIVNVVRPPDSPSVHARLMLLVALAAPLLAVFCLPRSGRASRWRFRLRLRDETLFLATVALSFSLLVGAGWTGSSLGLLLNEAAIANHDETPWLGQLRPVRSDEWLVVTPMAISQTAHTPAFPRVNHNLGPDGQNMLVIGMTGVPVAHLSALAKPATWGFFLFDLRRALAWYWWFPFFSCFAAVWLLLRRCFQLDWKLAAGLALTIAAAPYSVVFSGWPAYALFFPVAGVLAADAALRALRWRRALTAGGLLGLSIAGFALVLYPAWQIPLAYLFVPFALAWFATNRKELHFGARQSVSGIVALAVASLLLVAWWLDAHEAIASIRATVYPGQRSLEVGGDIDRWFLIKGLMSAVTLYQGSSLMWGASDAGSVVFFLVPAIAGIGLRLIRRRRVDPIAAVLFAFVAATLWFMFIGFPPSLAAWTLWGSATSYRLDLVLGMAQVLMFAWLASPKHAGGEENVTGRWVAMAVSALAAIQCAYLYGRVPPAIFETVPPSFIMLSLVAMALGSYLLVRGRHIRFFYVYALLMAIAAFPFNPLGLAPRAVSATSAMAQAAEGASSADAQAGKGISVVGEHQWATLLPAVGLPVVNSVFYYPPRTLWTRLDPQGKLRTTYNRYQRVFFVLAPMDAEHSYRIDSPRLDEVRVTLDPARFDFRLLGGRAVLTDAKDARSLAGNETLRLADSTPEWTLFHVVAR